MVDSINNMISTLSRLVGWFGSLSPDGNITFLDIAIWFLVLRMIPSLMKLIGQLSKGHLRKSNSSIKYKNTGGNSNYKGG